MYICSITFKQFMFSTVWIMHSMVCKHCIGKSCTVQFSYSIGCVLMFFQWALHKLQKEVQLTKIDFFLNATFGIFSTLGIFTFPFKLKFLGRVRNCLFHPRVCNILVNQLVNQFKGLNEWEKYTVKGNHCVGREVQKHKAELRGGTKKRRPRVHAILTGDYGLHYGALTFRIFVCKLCIEF